MCFTTAAAAAGASGTAAVRVRFAHGRRRGRLAGERGLTTAAAGAARPVS